MATMDYLQYEIRVAAAQQDLLLGMLYRLPFESYEEREDRLLAFLPAGDPQVQRETEEALRGVCLRLDLPDFARQHIPAQNWNAVWEKNFAPIRVGSFCSVRAPFHDQQEGVVHEIVMEPRMAFGTGHHATTYMMIELMQETPMRGKRLFDYGTGTGILAILAEKMGCRDIFAIDIEEEAYRNTLDNAALNDCSHIRAARGTLEQHPAGSYDIILANINRNVILASLPALHQQLSAGGVLLVSGILKEDLQLVDRAASVAGLKRTDLRQRQDWLALRYHPA